MGRNSIQKNIIVIGGGAAGMMAAIRASQCGASVVLLEKNDRLGKKLYITGKGRCNVTNDCLLDDFLKRFRNNGKFLRNAFHVFFNQDVVKFFRSYGVPLKIERQQRVFPESDRASSIVKALEGALKQERVHVRLNCEVRELALRQGEVIGVELNKGDILEADAVILATGGLSYPGTGSTGDGFKFSEKSGHHIEPLRPALVGLQISEDFPKFLEGLTLKNIKLTFTNGSKKVITGVGELLFTARGISGPLVVSHSGLVVDWLHGGKKVIVELDLKPGLSEKDLQTRFIRDFQISSRKILKNFLKNFLPQRMIEVFLKAGNVNPDKMVNQVTKEERVRLVGLLKKFHFTVVRAGSFATAMITQGGVSVKDIDPKTMQSRRVKDLFFAGEVIDVDADTGGFNLQAAFSTGYLAGQSSADK